MDNNEVVCTLTSLALILYVAWLITTKRRRHRPLPPGPKPWPVVGNMFQLAISPLPPHQTLSKLARGVHGPFMTLRLGSMLTVVASSSSAAREVLRDCDVALAGRKIYEAMKGERGKSSEGSLITAQYGAYWRMLRRLCTTQFFVTRRLDSMCNVRARCMDQMVRFVEEAGQNGTKTVDIGRYFFLMAFNLIGNLMFSKDLLDPDSKQGSKFFYHAGKVMEFAGRPNVSDFFPLLRFLDPQGIRRQTQFHVERAFEIAGEFIRERMEVMKSKGRDEKAKDYLDVLLEFRGDGPEEPSKFSSRTINVIVFEMFTAGTDTTTSTLEWALAELLHNPRTLTKLQNELRTSTSQTLQEQDLPNLPYLQAVIKETLRLHPPLPFLVPHKAMSTCHILNGQYTIPKETQVLVNVWAIGRDPDTWPDPMIFRPERFLSNPNPRDFKGHDFEFLPFGSGRRMCPALPLATRVLPMALGSMVRSFDWALADGLRPEELDMSERMGITLRKAIPLEAIPISFKGV
ncbi:PREDICTED: LOW QUALITY PROTEIN: cytochrome P450 76A1 [Tarenaya hassleriana]|uniref:LOW QUALITY PROTEIN: cytochrome P450 76A1 n=1 Tax=Tarenaya hassleriana TaxID=28532 RepID=UPI00053C1081|nr:PREDICTED: LOW QUALITY PROTEIN: cytochrome P450 76A1 [Tarenaya hassleriana]